MKSAVSAQILNRLWLIVLAVVGIAVLYLAKVLALPLAFAILFAFLLAPVASGLERLRIPRTFAALIVILGFAAVIGTAGWLLFSQLVVVVNDLPTYRDNIQQKIAAAHMPNDSAVGRAASELQRLGDQLGIANTSTTPDLQNGGKKPLGATPDRPVQVREVSHSTGRLDELGGIIEPLTTAFLAVVFTFFVLLQREDLRNRVIRLSGDHNLTMMTQAMDDAGRRISRYFRLQLTVNTIYASVIATALYFIGVPHALLFGAIAGMFRFVPYIGPPVSGSLPAILALAVYHGWEKALMVVGAFTVLEIVTANYAEPHIYGRHTGLSSLAILIAAAFWTLLWGPVGLILSVPLTVCLVVMGRHVPALGFLTVLLGDQPVIPPWTCFYQRLLAGDEREASEIVESYASGKSLENTFDTLLVPALIASERDRLQNDLDDDTVRFVRTAARDLIDDLADRPPDDENAEEHAWNSEPVLCIPVRDETDELAALMLARCLMAEGIPAVAAPVQPIDQLLEGIIARNPPLVFLTGLPPVGVARPRRIFRSLRARQPRLPIFIGIWSYADNGEKAAREISNGELPGICTNFAQAIEQVHALRRPAAMISESGKDPRREREAAEREAAERDAAERDAAERDAA